MRKEKKKTRQNIITTLNSFLDRFSTSKSQDKMLLTVTGESTLWTLLSSTRISLKAHTHTNISDYDFGF